MQKKQLRHLPLSELADLAQAATEDVRQNACTMGTMLPVWYSDALHLESPETGTLYQVQTNNAASEQRVEEVTATLKAAATAPEKPQNNTRSDDTNPTLVDIKIVKDFTFAE